MAISGSLPLHHLPVRHIHIHLTHVMDKLKGLASKIGSSGQGGSAVSFGGDSRRPESRLYRERALEACTPVHVVCSTPSPFADAITLHLFRHCVARCTRSSPMSLSLSAYSTQQTNAEGTNDPAAGGTTNAAGGQDYLDKGGESHALLFAGWDCLRFRKAR